MARSMKDFEVQQLLGKGSYGAVFKCKRKSDGLVYAVKEVNIRKLSPREREDAVNEIRILASINHVNVVRYCDAFVERDNLYIVMEFAEHGDIYRQIKKFKAANKYIKEDTIWMYAIQIALGLDHLHSRSVLHRDIKPKNIFLTSKHHVRLGDLGCAKLIKSGLARTQIGTPYYMSPEIWAARPYDGKSDVWALGCLVYELCALHPPFLADDMPGLSRKVKTAVVPRISRHYSDDLAGFVEFLLNKNPRVRPSVAQILSMPAVARRMGLVPVMPGHHASAPSSDRLLATIKVPRDVHRYKYQLALPTPSYPSAEDDPAPAAAAAASAMVAGPTSGSAKAPAAPSAWPPGARARAASPIVSPAKRAAQARLAGAVAADHSAAISKASRPVSAVRRVASDNHMIRRPDHGAFYGAGYGGHYAAASRAAGSRAGSRPSSAKLAGYGSRAPSSYGEAAYGVRAAPAPSARPTGVAAGRAGAARRNVSRAGGNAYGLNALYGGAAAYGRRF